MRARLDAVCIVDTGRREIENASQNSFPIDEEKLKKLHSFSNTTLSSINMLDWIDSSTKDDEYASGFAIAKDGSLKRNAAKINQRGVA